MKIKHQLKIGFFGTSNFALEALRVLHKKSFSIKYVITQNPKPSGRGQKISFSPVYRFARENNLNVFTPKNINNSEFINKIQKYKVDFIIVVAYGKIINNQILKLPKFYCLNIHASILPKWRGAAPIQRAILNGDVETGISIIVVEPKLDAGPIVLSKNIKINHNDNAELVHNKLAKLGGDLLIKAIINIVKNEYALKNQDELKSTYAKKISKEETKIVWNKNAQFIHAMIRAYTPWPGAWTNWKKGNKNIRVKIMEAIIIKNEDKYLLELDIGQSNRNLIVRCQKGFVKLQKLQVEGKNTITSKEFVNGFKLERYNFG